jgi:hypothetical protein
MFQSRYGGAAVPAFEVSKQELPYLDMPATPARRRASTYQIAGGIGAGAAGVGLLNTARTYTNERATRVATEAAEAAKAPTAATAAAARRASAAAAADAARSTSQTRRQLRRATTDYQRALPASSAATNRANATAAFAQRTMPRRLKLAGAGLGLIGGGFLMARSGARRRQEGN